MRPLPVPDELVDAMNAEQTDPLTWQRITMHPPDGNPTLANGSHCDVVEMLVETVAQELTPEVIAELKRRGQETPAFVRIPQRYCGRIAVTLDDLESMRRTGYLWISLSGNQMQPFAVFTEDLECDTGGGENVMRGIESACQVVASWLAQNIDPLEAMGRLHDVLAPWSQPTAPELTADDRPEDQQWDHQ